MYSEAQKRATYNWNKRNPEKYKEIQKRATEKYYQKNKEGYKKRAKAYYQAHKKEILQRLKEKRDKIKEEK